MRVDGGGVDQLAGGVDHGDLDAGAYAGVQAHDHMRTGGRGQQQVTQVVRKHLDRDFLGVLAQACEQVALGGQAELDAPGPGHAFADQVVCGTLLVAPAQVQRDTAFGQADHGAARHRRFGGRRLGFRRDQFHVQNVQRPAAEHRQRAVRGHAGDRLVVIKIVAELGHVRVVGVLAVGEL